jgi:hypothetical protein
VSAPAPKAPIASVAEAELAIGQLNTIMDRLEELVAEETARVRAGHLRRAVELDESKAELARGFAKESERLRAARPYLAQTLPRMLEDLRRRHEAFRAQLKLNLTVLATAHAVSEGIIRGVSGELARKQAPSTYGASGRANAPGPRASQPIAISKTL